MPTSRTRPSTSWTTGSTFLYVQSQQYINVNLTGILLCDRDQDVQLSQALAVGLAYNGGSKASACREGI